MDGWDALEELKGERGLIGVPVALAPVAGDTVRRRLANLPEQGS